MSEEAVVAPLTIRQLSVAVQVEGDVVRRGLTAMIKSTGTHELVEWRRFDDSGATDCHTDCKCPGVVLLDCDGANTEAVKVQATLAKAAGCKVLLLLLTQDTELFDAVSCIPANGFLMLHQITPASLDQALRDVLSGEIVVPSCMAGHMLTRLRTGTGNSTQRLDNLTPREQQALSLLVDGLSNKQIAKELRISHHGAKRLVANVLAKLNCPNRTLAVAVALRDNIITHQ